MKNIYQKEEFFKTKHKSKKFKLSHWILITNQFMNNESFEKRFEEKE